MANAMFGPGPAHSNSAPDRHDATSSHNPQGQPTRNPYQAWVLCRVSDPGVQVVDAVDRSLCPDCTTAVCKAYSGPCQVASRVRLEWVTVLGAIREVEAVRRTVLGLVPTGRGLRRLQAETRRMYGVINALLEQVPARAVDVEVMGRARAGPTCARTRERVCRPKDTPLARGDCDDGLCCRRGQGSGLKCGRSQRGACAMQTVAWDPGRTGAEHFSGGGSTPLQPPLHCESSKAKPCESKG